MLIEHFDLLSWFTKERAPETQRPCARLRDTDHTKRSASGDPAMVFEFRMASILSSSHGHLAPSRSRIAAGRIAHDRLSRIRKSGNRKIMRKRAQRARAYSFKSTTNVVLLEQRLVTRLVLPLDVVEERAARGDHFQKTTARMIVLHVALEVV